MRQAQVLLRIGGPLAGEMATHPLPVAAVARVAPPAATVAAFVHKYPAAALPGAELDPAQLRGSQELRPRSCHRGPSRRTPPSTPLRSQPQAPPAEITRTRASATESSRLSFDGSLSSGVSPATALVVTETFGVDGHLVLDERAAGVGVAALALALRAPVLVAVAFAALTTAQVRAFG